MPAEGCLTVLGESDCPHNPCPEHQPRLQTELLLFSSPCRFADPKEAGGEGRACFAAGTGFLPGSGSGRQGHWLASADGPGAAGCRLQMVAQASAGPHQPVHHLYFKVRVPTGIWRDATVWCSPAVFQQCGSGEEAGLGGLERPHLVRHCLIACSPRVTGKGTVAACPSTWCHCKALGGTMAWKDIERWSVAPFPG